MLILRFVSFIITNNCQVFFYLTPRAIFAAFDCRFVDINNAHDALTIRVGLSKSDQLAEQRAALLAKLHILPGNQIDICIAFFFFYHMFFFHPKKTSITDIFMCILNLV